MNFDKFRNKNTEIRIIIEVNGASEALIFEYCSSVFTWSEGGSTTRHGRKEVRLHGVVGRTFDYVMWSKGSLTTRCGRKEVRLHDVVERTHEEEQGMGNSLRPRERLEEVGRR